jgi:lipopolysaccharide transport system permease protein
MAGVVEGFRWALLHAAGPPLGLVALSTAISFLLLVTGVLYFRQTERRFADIV